jgi:hypothetical protein
LFVFGAFAFAEGVCGTSCTALFAVVTACPFALGVLEIASLLADIGVAEKSCFASFVCVIAPVEEVLCACAAVFVCESITVIVEFVTTFVWLWGDFSLTGSP